MPCQVGDLSRCCCWPDAHIRLGACESVCHVRPLGGEAPQHRRPIVGRAGGDGRRVREDDLGRP